MQNSRLVARFVASDPFRDPLLRMDTSNAQDPFSICARCAEFTANDDYTNICSSFMSHEEDKWRCVNKKQGFVWRFYFLLSVLCACQLYISVFCDMIKIIVNHYVRHVGLHSKTWSPLAN